MLFQMPSPFYVIRSLSVKELPSQDAFQYRQQLLLKQFLSIRHTPFHSVSITSSNRNLSIDLPSVLPKARALRIVSYQSLILESRYRTGEHGAELRGRVWNPYLNSPSRVTSLSGFLRNLSQSFSFWEKKEWNDSETYYERASRSLVDREKEIRNSHPSGTEK